MVVDPEEAAVAAAGARLANGELCARVVGGRQMRKRRKEERERKMERMTGKLGPAKKSIPACRLGVQ